MPQKPSSTDPTYWAFISYRHADNKVQDRDWATWLHQEIERYEVPAELVGTKNNCGDTIPEKIYPVFRDEESLSADSDLGSSIEKSLNSSRFLLVICSPRAVESKYVSEEVEYFKSSGKGNRIFAAIIAGEPGHPVNECFPSPLREIVNPNGILSKPIAADFRLPEGSEGYTSAEAYKRELLKTCSKREAFRNAEKYEERLQLMKLKIIAGILGLPIEVIRNRDKAYQLQKAKKRQKILTTIISIITVFALVATGSGILAWKNQKLAEQQTSLAEAEQKKQMELLWQASEADCEAGIDARDAGRNHEALALFERGFRYAPRNSRNLSQFLQLTSAEPFGLCFGHKFDGEVNTLAFSPDSSYIAAGSDDNTLRIFDTQGSVVWKASFGESVNTLAFSPDGSLIAAGLQDKTLRIFDVQGKELWKEKFEGGITNLAFSPDSLSIAAGSYDENLRIFDVQGKELWKAKFEGGITNLAFSPDSLSIAAGSYDETLRIFNNRGREVWKVNFGQLISSIAFSPDGSRIVAGSYDKTLRAFDPQGIQLWTKVFEKSVLTSALSPDGSCIAVGSSDEILRYIDAQGNELWNAKLDGYVETIAFSPDGFWIAAAGTNDKTLTVFDIRGRKLLRSQFGNGSGIKTLAFSPDGSRIAAGSSDGSLRVIDAQASEHWKAELEDKVLSLAYSPDGSLIASGSGDKTLRVFDAQGFELWKAKFAQRVNTLAFSPDGSRIAAGSTDQTLRIFEVQGRELWKAVFESSVETIAYSPNGSSIAVSFENNALRVFDTLGSKLWDAEFGDKVNTLAFSPDGSLIAAGSEDKTLRVFEAQGRELWKTNFESAVNSLAFSPDGSRIAVGSGSILRIIDPQGIELSKMNYEFVKTLAYSPDGSHLAVASGLGNLRVFDPLGEVLWATKFENDFGALAFSPDGSNLAAGSSEGALHIFDTQGKELWRTNFKCWIWTLDFSPDGSSIAAGSLDIFGASRETLRVFELPILYRTLQEDSTLLTAWITLQGIPSYDPNGRLSLPTSKETIKASQLIKSEALHARNTRPLFRHIRWRYAEPLHQTVSPNSKILVRSHISQKLRKAANSSNIISAHSRAPWHPLAPVSLARLENIENKTRIKFLCELTLNRLKAADPTIWGNDHLAEDATFAAKIMKELGYSEIAKKADNSLSLPESVSDAEGKRLKRVDIIIEGKDEGKTGYLRKLLQSQKLGEPIDLDFVFDDLSALEDSKLVQSASVEAKVEGENAILRYTVTYAPESKYPIGIPIPGKPGFVFNPYTNNVVDVRGIPPGTLIRDPNDPDKTHRFRVPEDVSPE